MTAELQQDDAAGAADGHGSSCQMLLNQLREITGIQDPSFLHEALKASNGDITQAVSLLTDERVKEPSQDTVATEPSEVEGSAANKEVLAKVIDLTHDNKDDLQAAIALSLLESPKIQADGRDLNRMHEATSAETKRSKRKRCEVWGENPNPNDWRRVDGWPVGLKNVGNTCWFSAVIQSLFQLPEFRRLVLSYSLPQNVLENCRSHTEKRNIMFMQELQYLFALMMGSNRKFVDPSAALDLLKGAFRSSEEQQQDVSEFTHKLLDWLEDAFQLAVNVNSPRNKSENPMVQLFYGTFLTEGVREGKPFCNNETFGQYPLQVNGYRNLDECLEGAMVEGDVELLPSDHSVKYGQERWFTKLPPVLTFELSRFEFNQSLGQPEKIHNKLEFPQIIYMDRYMYRSKELIRNKRECIRKLKEEIKILQQKLERYVKYGSGPARFPLPDMLKYVIEFASTKPASESCPPESDTHMTLPLSSVHCSVSDQTSKESTSTESSSQDVESTFSSPEDSLPKSKPLTSSRSSMEMPSQPAPRTVTDEEINFVKTCLQRWRSEIEQDIQDLKTCIASTTQTIEQMYCDPLLRQVPYRLHAVLVHEGQANAGHYWAYIYNQPRQSWLKYNDISVTESSWEEVERDSYGGLRNVSAYCLMYINDKLPYFNAEAAPTESDQMSEVEALSVELKHYIQEDNWRFEQEVEEWEEEQSCKIPQMESSTNSSSQDYSTSQEPSVASSHGVRCLSSEHAVIVKEQTAQAIANTARAYEKSGVEAALSEVMLSPAMQGVILAIAKARQTFDRDGSEAGLIKAFHEEYSRLYQLAKETPTSHSDPRLQHVLVYFFQNEAPKRVVERTLLEQFADKNLSYDERSISIMKVAQAKLKEIGPDDMNMEEYKKWHEDYSLFRKVSVYLLTGLELYQKGKYQEALSYLVYAYQSNAALLMKGPRRGVKESVIALYRRKCLLELNAKAASLFETNDDHSVTEGINVMNELIIPCIHLIINNDISKDDLDAIEVMRNHWCSYLGQDIAENLQLCLGEFLPRLLDPSAEIIVLKEPPTIRPNSPYDLCSRFAAVMESIQGVSTVTVK
ncbi:ubiquitin specific peptidase 28 [Homo sapiens]|uniref:Ubiquitin carboxyl-terminal hydrolase 28 n=2 Tax=Homo sapiens TaxID=9606 RepID=UBP28_HUMAN|nr:ubiquitin carboxyl-terminal hydrolase 28 isoform a [Homo sapiens]Q96RU2.1 RecName: Full=Ubiquitin carboxyl-terminal hydrolase 28; AltName: Full=Deubiquitinating enzyme 28; AltName: Full=Ubiquitin thioesterase 28; AltName: Full=Ubiquitin-specific-processing protease 28 [Homo sapiens]AAK58565.1 ubiquitin specific protease [Homo sapiens]ACA06098.1 ubiquitin carboxyl-terminal hydrolase 28 variant 2 [Homo sapiens]EAW67232.1 ubiquitin specific peptidase 28, isoform CRA_b [Homo sapiens]KAI2562879.|eukprot:NP_065937.1 ubiquitin carboxyl-terminal hydrolase 28 isoform a [Homo sapiens]